MSFKLYRRQRSPFWWCSIVVPGRKRIRRSCGTDNKARAGSFAEAIEAREWKRRTDGDEATLTFWEAALLYQQDGKPADYLKPLMLHFREQTVATIKPGDIQAAARSIYPGRSPATQNRQGIVPARAVINHAADRGLCSHIKVRLFRVFPPARKAADGDWLTRFTEQAPPHLAALALFMASTGARISQALEITWKAVNLQQGEVRIPAAKGFPERIAYLTPDLVAALANIHTRKHRLKARRLRKLVFGLSSRSSIYRQWRKACQKARIPYLPSHQSGRHTFFTEMIVRNGVDVKTAADLGGSASPALLLKTYVHSEGGKQVINRVFGTPVAHPDSENASKPAKNKA